MIVSHKYRFIYLRTEKTASTSLSKALQAVIGDEDEVMRSYRGRIAKALPVHPGGLKRHMPEVFGLHVHAKAAQVRRVLGSEIFDSYYKFAVERNPWERQLSLYFHRASKEGRSVDLFDESIRSPLYNLTHYNRLNNWAIYAIGDEIVADEVLRYESLAQDLPRLLDRLGIADKVELPRLNSGRGGARRHYSTYYTDESREIVARWHRREIAAFDYRFETPEPADSPPLETPA